MFQIISKAAMSSAARQVATKQRSYVPKKPLSERLSQLAFDAGQFDSFFSRWLPSTTRTISVKVIGGRSAPLSSVVQFAASAAFGIANKNNEKIRPVNYGLGLKVDHVNNAVNLVLSVQTMPMWEALVTFGKLQDEMVKEKNWKIDGVDLDALANKLVKSGITDLVLPGWIKFIPGVNDAAQDVAGKAVAKAIELATRIAQIMSESTGATAFWDIGKDDSYKGGKAFPALDPIGPGRAKLFKALDGAELFTRKPAENHQPPSANGSDLRTLVAQVLHDPGVMPPFPRTDRGEPTIPIA